MEKSRKKYSVGFSNLPLGKHEFEIDIDDSFFEFFEFSQIKKGQLKVKLLVDKKPAMAFFDFKIVGTVGLECDRCLDEIDFPIDAEYRLIGKESSDPGDDQNEELFQLPLGQTTVDLSEPIYEFIHLSLPMNKVCADTAKGSCNEEVVKKLNELLINKENQDDDDESPWDALKGLKL